MTILEKICEEYENTFLPTSIIPHDENLNEMADTMLEVMRNIHTKWLRGALKRYALSVVGENAEVENEDGDWDDQEEAAFNRGYNKAKDEIRARINE